MNDKWFIIQILFLIQILFWIQNGLEKPAGQNFLPSPWFIIQISFLIQMRPFKIQNAIWMRNKIWMINDFSFFPATPWGWAWLIFEARAGPGWSLGPGPKRSARPSPASKISQAQPQGDQENLSSQLFQTILNSK